MITLAGAKTRRVILCFVTSFLFFKTSTVVAQGAQPNPSAVKRKTESDRLCKALEKDYERPCDEVTLGAQAWTYQRLYPLLKSLYINFLTATANTNPNGINATQTDAITQSFQVQAGYNQLAQQQNNAASQMLSQNLTYQSQVLQQIATATSAEPAAIQKLNDAKLKLAKDSSASKPDTDTIAKDNQAIADAQNTVDTLTAQLTALNGQAKAPVYSPSYVSAPTVTTPTAPTAISASTASQSGGNGPSFPATKILQNDVQFYWTKLLTTVGLLVKPDSAKADDQIFMLQFDTGIFPVKRKHELLDLSYELVCKDGGDSHPTVLDLFPRMAAINVTDNKYRDTQFNLGAILSWLGFGLDASYNREHLHMSQVLSQAAYITGYGVGQSEFGWKFGISLGDDALSSDTRTTFALVSVPSGCTPEVHSKDSNWVNSDAKIALRHDNLTPGADLKAWKNINFPAASTSTAAGPPGGKLPSNSGTGTRLVDSVEYNRLEYATAASGGASSAVVSVILNLNFDMDQQTSVRVNGIPLKRVLDTEGGATNAASIAGVFETDTFGVNTWTPSGSRTLILNLDGTKFGERFPQIILAGPLKTYDLSAEMVKACPNISVSGSGITGTTGCLNHLPSLAYPQGSGGQLSSARVLQGLSDSSKTPMVLFSIQDSSATQAAAAAATNTNVQVITSSTDTNWGANPEVYRTIDESVTFQKLDCKAPQGSRLLCVLPDHVDNGAKYHILDLHHRLSSTTSGTLSAWSNQDPCIDAKSDMPASDTCRIPTYWNMQGPDPLAHGLGWKLTFQFVNVNTGDKVPKMTATLTGLPGDSFSATQIDASEETKPATVEFDITPADWSKLQNNMTLSIGGLQPQMLNIANLETKLSPTTATDTDLSSFAGSNLIDAYDTVKIGTSTKTHKINCHQGICRLAETEAVSMKDEKAGAIFLMANGSPAIPLLIADTTTQAKYVPPDSKGTNGGSGGSATTSTTQISNNPGVTINNIYGVAQPDSTSKDLVVKQPLTTTTPPPQ